MRIYLLLPVFLTLAVAVRAAGDLANGSMEGPPQDHSDGQGLLVTPPSWTPVNINPDRGDRLSVEPSDRPGGGQCLRVRTFGSDAGVYQTVAPLAKGRTYLVSAWVKRLSGTLALEAYAYGWGPAIMRRLDSFTSGWTRLTVGLSTIDEGAHLYLVAAPRAEFLIDDVELRPASVQVSAPQLQPYDLGSRWRYRVRIAPLAGAVTPAEVDVQAVSDVDPGRAYGRKQRLALAQAAVTELALPLRKEGTFCVEVTDPATGEVLGGSPITVLPGTPWVVRFPHKDSLYASLGYRWPVRVELTGAAPETVAGLTAVVTVTDEAGRVRLKAEGSGAPGRLVTPLDGRRLPPGEYHLSLSVRSPAGRQVYGAERPLRVLPPAASEVVVAPNGDTLVNGQRFFPIGLYWVLADPAGWKPGPQRKTADLNDLLETGFNTLHSYAFEHNDANDTDDNAAAYLDMAQELGFMVMMGLRRDWYQGETLHAVAIEQRVRRLRHHPALLCWTLWDEPDFSTANVPRVQAVYDLVNRLDPYHPAMPVFMNTMARRAFRNAADINLFDCYPANGQGHILPGVLAQAHRAIPDKPVWYVARAYQQGESLPSEAEMRQYWRDALAADVKGIFWYSYGGDGQGWDSIRITPEHYAAVKRVVRELAEAVKRR